MNRRKVLLLVIPICILAALLMGIAACTSGKNGHASADAPFSPSSAFISSSSDADGAGIDTEAVTDPENQHSTPLTNDDTPQGPDSDAQESLPDEPHPQSIVSSDITDSSRKDTSTTNDGSSNAGKDTAGTQSAPPPNSNTDTPQTGDSTHTSTPPDAPGSGTIATAPPAPTESSGGAASGTPSDASTPSGAGDPSTGSTDNSSEDTSSGDTPVPPVHTHSWTPVYTTVHHKDTTRTETQVVSEAVYETRAVCNQCGADVTSDSAYETHLIEAGHSSYSVTRVKVADAVTKEVEILVPGYDESILTGYQCECGATKAP